MVLVVVGLAPRAGVLLTTGIRNIMKYKTTRNLSYGSQTMSKYLYSVRLSAKQQGIDLQEVRSVNQCTLIHFHFLQR